MSHYLELRGLWPAGREDELSLALAVAPTLGARIGAESEGLVELAVYLAGDRAADAFRVADFLRGSGARDLEIIGVAGRDWLAEYRASAEPFAVGRGWWIDPHPEAPTPAPAGRRRLAVVPRSAFGSGSHESTRLALSLLEELDVRDRRVLDAGTGSGILALAAAALGARLVVGLDIDPAAVAVARTTLAQQQEPLDVALFVGEIAAVDRGRFDLVLCNMISSRFLPLLGELQRALEGFGRLVLSGFLTVEGDTVAQAVRRQGLQIERSSTEGQWAGLTAVFHGR